MSAIHDALRRARYHSRVPTPAFGGRADAVFAAVASRPERRRPDASRFLAVTTLMLIAGAAAQSVAWVTSLATPRMPEIPAGTTCVYSPALRLPPDVESSSGAVIATAGSTNLRAQNARGLHLLEQGDAVAAVSVFRGALRERPDDVGLLVNMGIALQAAGNAAEARASLMHAESLEPRNAAVRYNLAILYDRDGNARKAREHYRAFLQTASAADTGRMADVRRRLTELDDHTR